MKQMKREESFWGHVQGTLAVPGAILILATLATPVVPTIVAAMDVAAAPSVAIVATFAGVM